MKKYIILFAVSVIFLPLSVFAYFSKDLYFGMRGDLEVTALQEFLIEKNLYAGPVTGNFLSLTLSAVKNFQTAQGITPISGYFGPITRGKANQILSSQGVSGSSVTTEEGTTATVSVTPPKTTDDVVSSLMAQIVLIQQQLAELQQQNQSLQQGQQTLQQQQQTLQTIQQDQQTQNQILSQIQQNTTLPPPPPPPPPVVKDLTVTADKTSVQLAIWNNVKVTAQYTEDGKPIAGVSIAFSAPDDSKTFDIIGNWSACGNLKFLIQPTGTIGGVCSSDGKIDFSYTPKTLGIHTISVTAGGITKSVDVLVNPYVKVDPLVHDVFSTNASTGFFISPGDEPIRFSLIRGTANPSGFISSFFRQGKALFNGTFSPSFVLTSIDTYPTSNDEKVSLSTSSLQPGTYTITITDIEVIGLDSGLFRDVQGLPITFILVAN